MTSMSILPSLAAALPDIDGRLKDVTRPEASPNPLIEIHFLKLTVAGRIPIATTFTCGCSMVKVTEGSTAASAGRTGKVDTRVPLTWRFKDKGK